MEYTMNEEQLKNLFDLAHIQIFSSWAYVRDAMLQAHAEIVRLQARVKELETKNADS